MYVFNSWAPRWPLCFYIRNIWSYLISGTHITSIVSCCMSKLGQINRVQHVFNPTLLSTIIHMLVFSKLFYCSPIWFTTSAGNIARLQHAQNFAAASSAALRSSIMWHLFWELWSGLIPSKFNYTLGMQCMLSNVWLTVHLTIWENS